MNHFDILLFVYQTVMACWKKLSYKYLETKPVIKVISIYIISSWNIIFSKKKIKCTLGIRASGNLRFNSQKWKGPILRSLLSFALESVQHWLILQTVQCLFFRTLYINCHLYVDLFLFRLLKLNAISFNAQII